MEHTIDHVLRVVPPAVEAEEREEKTFITANTIGMTVREMSDQHVIPVFVRENEPVISHTEFIQATERAVADTFYGEQVLKPMVRVSHPIMGRVPEAKDKPAIDLLDHERTIYYERMAFAIEVPSTQRTVDGNRLSLCIGGVKSYGADNLFSRSVSDQHFKVFVGFKNLVCCNMCVRTDGYQGELKVKTADQLYYAIQSLLLSFPVTKALDELEQLPEYSISENQFAHVLGRCRMYTHLPTDVKRGIAPLLFNDTQIAAVCRDYYRDKSFSKGSDGSISLWRMFNLFTGVNKTSYIDTFLDRSVNASSFIQHLKSALAGSATSWYLH